MPSTVLRKSRSTWLKGRGELARGCCFQASSSLHSAPVMWHTLTPVPLIRHSTAGTLPGSGENDTRGRALRSWALRCPACLVPQAGTRPLAGRVCADKPHQCAGPGVTGGGHRPCPFLLLIIPHLCPRGPDRFLSGPSPAFPHGRRSCPRLYRCHVRVSRGCGARGTVELETMD